MQSFISGQPSVQGEEGDGLPNQTSEMVEFGWNMIKVNTVPNVSAPKICVLIFDIILLVDKCGSSR